MRIYFIIFTVYLRHLIVWYNAVCSAIEKRANFLFSSVGFKGPPKNAKEFKTKIMAKHRFRPRFQYREIT